MKPSSAKAKGRRLQDEIRETLHEHYPDLRDGDIKTAVMGESGRDIVLSPAAEDRIPLDIEAKNQEKLNVWSSLKQAEANAKDGRVPALVFRRNRSETYVALKFTDLLTLISPL